MGEPWTCGYCGFTDLGVPMIGGTEEQVEKVQKRHAKVSPECKSVREMLSK